MRLDDMPAICQPQRHSTCRHCGKNIELIHSLNAWMHITGSTGNAYCETPRLAEPVEKQ